ncbi:phage antirepressor Ant [Finegoldia sp. BIOML-A3]|uniref:phage antirepressor KilAC domain-containing protein n=1 Tax=unclassified Finegoldia TaxID=2619637 RepID=UPI0012AF6333|nr:MULTISPECIES: phage antirepressor KilAC domain-containing protein [unclassified Finegoldia]MSA99656.1 phage antirepressor Ant [Finegoldia sp. BIOML-A3]MSB93642.1 phage antirepressor Ant [Finegoldia sp. BIOML-A4]
MNELKIFQNSEFGEIRTVTKNNEPWFVAIDVCNALDLKNPTVSVGRLDEDEVTKFNLGGLSGESNIVSEYGLYNLILASRKKEAKKFKRWITHEVIPTIRKHGAYMTSEVIEKTLSDPDYLIRLATNLKEEKARRALAEAQIEKDKPKVLFADSCEVAENSILIGEFAKRLKQNGFDIGQNKLFEWLRQHDYLCKSGERKNLPTQYSMERGLFEVKTRIMSNPNGSVRTTSTTKITGKGQIYFTNKFLGA